MGVFGAVERPAAHKCVGQSAFKDNGNGAAVMGKCTRPIKTAPDRSQRPLRLRVDRYEKPRGRRGFHKKPALRATRRYAALRCISRLHTITLISASTSTSENHTPNRVSGPFFSSPGLDGSARRCFFAATSASSAASRGRFSAWAGASSREGGGGGSI